LLSGLLLTCLTLSDVAAIEAYQQDQPARFEIELPEGGEIWNNWYFAELAISPDGRYVVFTNRGESPARLYRRDLREGTTIAIPGIDRGAVPFFSADGQWVAYVAQGKLRKVPLEGGEPVDLADIENFFGGAWGPDGTIVYAPEPGGGLYTVSESGGPPKRLTEQGWYPSFLPDGRSVIFNTWELGPTSTIAVVDIQTGKIDFLPIAGRAPQYVASGHILFGRDLDLYAAQFDPVTRAVGEARPIVRDLGTGVEPPRQFAVSENGTLVYIAGGKTLPVEPVRVDLEGSVTALGMPPAYYVIPRESPDGSMIAFDIRAPEKRDVWVVDAAGGEPRALTSDGDSWLVDWLSDDEVLIWRGPNPGTIQALPVMPGGTPRDLMSGAEKGLDWIGVDGITPDGGSLVGRVPSQGEGNGDIALFHLERDGEIEVLAGSTEAGVEHHTGTVSPDGHWLAFVSDKSGNREVHVIPFSGPGPDHIVSGAASGWARYPHWSLDSRGIYYIQGGQMWFAGIGSNPEEPVAEQRSLFELPDEIFWGSGNYTFSNFDLAPDGQSFLALRGVGEWKAPTHISGLTNVFAAIEAAFADTDPD
jgi:Tol biopolymer transport system component